MVDVILSGRCGREVLSLADPLPRIITVSVIPRWPVGDMVITCIYRTEEEDDALGASGIHATIPPRAIDIRIRNLAVDPQKAQEKADEIAAEVNKEWLYDPTRLRLKVAVAKQHGTGPHLHLQVFPGRTTMIS